MIRRAIGGFATGMLCLAAWVAAANAMQAQHAVLVGGLGGSPAYSSVLLQHLFDAHAAFTGPLGLPDDNVTVLSEPASLDSPVVDGVANAESIRATFAALATRVAPQDQVYVILFGHGSFDGRHAMLNIARRDLTSLDYAQLVDVLPSRRVVFVNTASASGPFVEALSATDRIVITATRSGTQRNQTIFPRFFVEALASPSADLNRDGRLSVLEVFNWAAMKTASHFEEDGHLATEHALIDDNGDGTGARQERLAESVDGYLAAVTYLRQPALAEGGGRMAGLLSSKEEILREVAALKARKGSMSEDNYYDALEVLMVQLARLSDAMGQSP